MRAHVARAAVLTLVAGALIVHGVPVPLALAVPGLILFARAMAFPTPYAYLARTDDHGNVTWCIGNRAEAERDAREDYLKNLS